jgi:hypothetical protein
MIRKAKAVWRSSGRAGNGDLTTDSSVLAQTPYSFKTRFEDEKGTNPEELIASHNGAVVRMKGNVRDAALVTDGQRADIARRLQRRRPQVVNLRGCQVSEEPHA